MNRRTGILTAGVALVSLWACGGDSQTATTSPEAATTMVTAAPTTSPPSATAPAATWDRDTLVAMEECVSRLRLVIVDGPGNGNAEYADEACDPAATQVAVDADVIGTYEASTFSSDLAYVLVELSFYILNPTDDGSVESAAQRVVDQWETVGP
jgi:hypothetical protein